LRWRGRFWTLIHIQGQDGDYWGKHPANHFDGGKFTTEPGFITMLD